MRVVPALALALSVAVAVAVVAFAGPVPERAAVTNRPISVKSGGYIGSESCQACHPGNYHSWHESFHRTMTQVPNRHTVTGTFEGSLTSDGLEYRLHQDGDRFTVSVAGGEPRQVVLSTGSHHMQAYWLAPSGPGRRLGLLPFIFLHEEQRWVPRVAAFLQPPRHNGGVDESGMWNANCERCHATQGRPRVTAPDVMDTQVAEFGIACEACHGPGEEHVSLHRNPWRRYLQRTDDEPDPSIVNPRRLPHDLASETCGQCHSVWIFNSDQTAENWNEHGFSFRPGGDLSKTRFIQRRDHMGEGDPERSSQQAVTPDYWFWSDGMIRVSGREFNGLIESPCYQKGELSCLSCHSMHTRGDASAIAKWADDQLAPGMHGDQACLQCHDSIGSRLAEHTHHAPASDGSRCYNCHMTYTTFGLLKAIRSHEISTPDVAASLATGRPNACNQCHLDKTLGWSAEHLAQWYGIAAPELGELERSLAASVLWTLRGDAGQRALMAWSFGWQPAQRASGEGWMAPFVAVLLDDPYDAVRFMAGRSLRSLPGFKNYPYDFLASRERRMTARDGVLKLWGERGNLRGRTESALLMEPGGALRLDELNRLIQQRDNRPVMLLE